MSNKISKISKFFSERKEYFANCRNEIAEKNLKLLCLVSIVTFIMTSAFILITPVMLPEWKVTLHYILFLPSIFVFIIFSVLYSIFSKRPNPSVVTGACILLYIVIISFLIAIDVFAYPALPATFIPLLLVVFPIVFVLRWEGLFPVLIIGEIVFAISTFMVKKPEVANHDFFRSIAGFAFAIVVDYIVSSLRLDDYKAKMRYKKLSRIDSLTSIYNKAACENAVRKYLTTRRPGNICAMLIIDIDNFKDVNDKLGHTMGDRVLEEFGNLLLNIFGPQHIIGRFGGDEFLILITNMQDRSVAGVKCGEILKRLSNLVMIGGLPIRCSIGAIVVDGTVSNYSELFQSADEALYQAKSQGKNRFVIHNFTKTVSDVESRKIMLSIDADQKDLLQLRNMFYSSFTIKEATDSEEIYADLEKYKDEIAVIFLDVYTPSLNGEQILKYIKSNDDLKKIPVIAIISDDMTGEKTLKLGASELIRKPIDAAIAKMRVHNTIEKLKKS